MAENCLESAAENRIEKDLKVATQEGSPMVLKKEIRIDKLSESISILPSLESVAQPQQSSARFEPLKIDSATSPLLSYLPIRRWTH